MLSNLAITLYIGLLLTTSSGLAGICGGDIFKATNRSFDAHKLEKALNSPPAKASSILNNEEKLVWLMQSLPQHKRSSLEAQHSYLDRLRQNKLESELYKLVNSLDLPTVSQSNGNKLVQLLSSDSKPPSGIRSLEERVKQSLDRHWTKKIVASKLFSTLDIKANSLWERGKELGRKTKEGVQNSSLFLLNLGTIYFFSFPIYIQEKNYLKKIADTESPWLAEYNENGIEPLWPKIKKEESYRYWISWVSSVPENGLNKIFSLAIVGMISYLSTSYYMENYINIDDFTKESRKIYSSIYPSPTELRYWEEKYDSMESVGEYYEKAIELYLLPKVQTSSTAWIYSPDIYDSWYSHFLATHIRVPDLDSSKADKESWESFFIQYMKEEEALKLYGKWKIYYQETYGSSPNLLVEKDYMEWAKYLESLKAPL